MTKEADWDGKERRAETHITDEQIEAIAKKAATIAVQQFTDEMYKTVGKTVVSKFLMLVGIIAVGLYSLALSRGWIKL